MSSPASRRKRPAPPTPPPQVLPGPRTKLEATLSFVRSLGKMAGLQPRPGYKSYMPIPERVLYLLHNAHPFHNGGYAVRAHGILRAVRSWGFDVQAVLRPGYPWDRVHEARYVDALALIDGVPYHYPDRGLPALDWATPTAISTPMPST